LTACHEPPAVRQSYVVRTAPPELLAPCPPEPAKPGPGFNDVGLALWIRDVIAAGHECRRKHEALADFEKGGGNIR
jgi:hypothetical protein